MTEQQIDTPNTSHSENSDLTNPDMIIRAENILSSKLTDLRSALDEVESEEISPSTKKELQKQIEELRKQARSLQKIIIYNFEWNLKVRQKLKLADRDYYGRFRTALNFFVSPGNISRDGKRQQMYDLKVKPSFNIQLDDLQEKLDKISVVPELELRLRAAKKRAVEKLVEAGFEEKEAAVQAEVIAAQTAPLIEQIQQQQEQIKDLQKSLEELLNPTFNFDQEEMQFESPTPEQRDGQQPGSQTVDNQPSATPSTAEDSSTGSDDDEVAAPSVSAEEDEGKPDAEDSAHDAAQKVINELSDEDRQKIAEMTTNKPFNAVLLKIIGVKAFGAIVGYKKGERSLPHFIRMLREMAQAVAEDAQLDEKGSGEGSNQQDEAEGRHPQDIKLPNTERLSEADLNKINAQFRKYFGNFNQYEFAMSEVGSENSIPYIERALMMLDGSWSKGQEVALKILSTIGIRLGVISVPQGYEISLDNRTKKYVDDLIENLATKKINDTKQPLLRLWLSMTDRKNLLQKAANLLVKDQNGNPLSTTPASEAPAVGESSAASAPAPEQVVTRNSDPSKSEESSAGPNDAELSLENDEAKIGGLFGGY